MSNLLISEHPLQVLPSLAKEIGLNEAIFLQQLHYWLLRSNHIHDNKRWIYNTYEGWAIQFSWWSERTIRRIIQSLRDKNYISATDRFNTDPGNRTLWYTIEYQNLPSVQFEQAPSTPCGQNGHPHDMDKMDTPCGQNVHVIYGTETTTENNNREYEPPRARAREEPQDKNVLSQDKNVLNEPCDSEPHVKALVAKLHSVGVMTNPYITDKYMDLHEVDNIPFEYILRGITAAADNGKQHHFSYVSACIRNAAKGVTPDQLKKNTEQDETHRAIVENRRGHAAADVDWKEINRLYSPFGAIDAIPQ